MGRVGDFGYEWQVVAARSNHRLAESQGRRGTPRTNIRADSRTQAPAPDRVKDLGFERPAASGSTPLITVTSDAARKARRAEHVLGET